MSLAARFCATARGVSVLSAATAISPTRAQGSGSATLDAARACGEPLCRIGETVPGVGAATITTPFCSDMRGR